MTKSFRFTTGAAFATGVTNTIGLTIRSADFADLGVLVDFRLAMLDEIGRSEHPIHVEATPDLRTATEDWFEDHLGRDVVGLVAEADGAPVAAAAFMWFKHPPGPTDAVGLEAYVFDVYTVPGWRRRGAARGLMQRVIIMAHAAEASRIWLRTSQEGWRLYESMGFRTGGYLELWT